MSPDGQQVREALLGVDHPTSETHDDLDRAEFGVLGLSNGTDSYTIPLSFGYDEDLSTLYFLLLFEEDSRKREFISTTEQASFVVVESELPDSWHSILFTGPITPVPAEETQGAYSALADTAAFPAPFTFDDGASEEAAHQSLYELDVETMTARRATDRDQYRDET